MDVRSNGRYTKFCIVSPVLTLIKLTICSPSKICTLGKNSLTNSYVANEILALESG